jgi:hypothetical protein
MGMGVQFTTAVLRDASHSSGEWRCHQLEDHNNNRNGNNDVNDKVDCGFLAT